MVGHPPVMLRAPSEPFRAAEASSVLTTSPCRRLAGGTPEELVVPNVLRMKSCSCRIGYHSAFATFVTQSVPDYSWDPKIHSLVAGCP